jgi:hypothetical protein
MASRTLAIVGPAMALAFSAPTLSTSSAAPGSFDSSAWRSRIGRSASTRAAAVSAFRAPYWS